MAQKVFVKIVDDLDGSTLDEGEGETVVFGVDGTEHEIDLSPAHAAELREALAPYVKAGRRRPKGAPAVKRGKVAKPDLEAIRAWANGNGFEVSARGRVPAAAVEAYNAAKR